MFKKINEKCYLIVGSGRKNRNYLVCKGKVTQKYLWLSKLQNKFNKLFSS